VAVDVVLGGRTFKIEPLPLGASRAWRARFQEPFSQLTAALQAAPNVALSDLAGVAGLLQVAKDVLIGSMELAHEMLFAYAPNLAAERGWIEAHAYDDEALRALVEVLKLAYPFGCLLQALTPGPPVPKIAKK
jgi:hypothetical protein